MDINKDIFFKDEPATQNEIIEFIMKDHQLHQLFEKLKTIDHSDASHDIHHFIRVARVARWASFIIAQELKEHETNDIFFEIKKAIAASLMHDIVNVPKNDPRRSQASFLSAQEAYQTFIALGFLEVDAIDMQNAIRTHSFSRGETPVSFLGKALQDADRLDAIGVLGIMRCFYTSGKMGSELLNSDDVWGRHRMLDDKKYAIDHFAIKLLHLAKGMHTKIAQMEAKNRTNQMHVFLAQVGKVIGDDYI